MKIVIWFASNIFELFKVLAFIVIGIIAFCLCLGVMAASLSFWYVAYYEYHQHDYLLATCAFLFWLCCMAIVGAALKSKV